VALLLETVREPDRLRAALVRAAVSEVPVVLLSVGGTPPGAGLVAAHSGALAGADAAWEALTDAHGLVRVEDLDEMADVLELFGTGRRVRGGAGPGPRRTGIATVHDSGAERALVADIAHRAGVPFAEVSVATTDRLRALLDPGLEPANPLDVWGRGSSTRQLFADCLSALADDDAVQALALAVDLVPEYDGDDSYPMAVLDVAARTDKPVAVLSNMASALDQQWAGRLRDAGVPVLEGTRSGLRALGHLLGWRGGSVPSTGPAVDEQRRSRWRSRLAQAPLAAGESFALLGDYGIAVTRTIEVSTRAAATAAAEELGWPVVVKTARPDIAHKTEVGGVVLGLADADAVVHAYDDLTARLGPRVLVCATAPAGVELSLGIATDSVLGPMVVIGAGGVLVELLAERAVGLPPIDTAAAVRLVDRLRLRPLLDGVRGGPPVDVSAVVAAVVAMSELATELGDVVVALDINPLVAGPSGAVAADALVAAAALGGED
jgi:acyl-CoA synthetase (NDP forming)